MRNSVRSQRKNWIDAIEHHMQQHPGESYYELGSLRKNDSVVYTCMNEGEFFGLYNGLRVPKVEEGVKGFVLLRLFDGKDIKIPGRITEVCGRQYRFILSNTVKSFEVSGSLSTQIMKVRKEIKKKRLVEDYLMKAYK